jgi:predicted DCC family thiol-disulfide oxidoreductase YuxK
MRMDNETYRLKVENLFDMLRDEENVWRPEVQSALEQLALSPRKGRYFLRVVSVQPQAVQAHFYSIYMQRAHRDDSIQDLERHIRHMFYEAREDAKAVLAQVVSADTLPALFRVIALTDEGWLAGELIRIALSASSGELYEPIRRSLWSDDYLLQCLAIYLVGKSEDEQLLGLLAKFYRRPEGEKLDRLEKKSYDALLEGGRNAPERLISSWLRDKHSRVRDVALSLTAERLLPEVVADLVGLVLVDAKTRTRAAAVLLSYEQLGIVSWDPTEENSSEARKMIGAAKRGPLVATLRSLLRHESPLVREVAVKLVRLAPASDELCSQMRRLVTEDKASAVQIAAMHTLHGLDRSKLKTALMELFSADAAGREALEAAESIMETLSSEETRQITEGIRSRLERREAALDRFVASVEWWRHDT